MPITLGNQLLSDIDETCTNDKAICSHIANIDVNIIEAWDFMQTARPTLNYRKDWLVLEQLKLMLSAAKAESLNTLGGPTELKELFKKNKRVPCSVCVNLAALHLNPMDEYIKDLDYFGSNFASNFEGFASFLGNTGLKGTQIYHVEGAAFTLRVLREEGLNSSTIDGFEMQYNEENEKVVDIKKKNGILVECKSWEINGPGFQNVVAGTSGSFSQFISYISVGITKLSDLEYWFDKRKITGATDEIKETAIKQKFQNMMLQNNALTTKGTNVFNAIWGNSGLRNMFDISVTATKSPVEQFKDIVSDTSNSFYNFILVK